MSAFHNAFRHTVGIEGGYVDDPSDSGGATKYGITETVARAFGYNGRMRDLTIQVAENIYRQNYWDLLRLDGIADLSPAVAAELFDTAVNCGAGFAGRCLQQALNALNRQEKDYPDIIVDGLFGLMTGAAFRAYMNCRGADGEVVLMRALNALQGVRYIDISQSRPKDERFVFGWFLNRVVI